MPETIDAKTAIARLQEGNSRFANNRTTAKSSQVKPADLAGGQSPFAIILGCSDSRVPAEIIFDQGLGDLFVIRVAGNIVAPSQIGSVEFAAAQFNTKLVVVLGHSDCGAIKATLEELDHPAEARSPNLRSIVDRIRPAVQSLIEIAHIDRSAKMDAEEFVDKAVRANISASVGQLRHGSSIIEDLTAKQGLRIVGAEYSVRTGIVEFL